MRRLLVLFCVAVAAIGIPPTATALAAPTVASVTPPTGPTAGGTRVTITGARFSRVSKVLFGTTQGSAVTVVSSTKISVTAPPQVAGTVHVRVVSANGTSSAVTADRFTYIARPSVTNVAPDTGPLAGGSRVTVTGVRFLGVTRVYFGTTPGTAVKVLSSTKLTVVVPAHASGTNHVRVVTAYGTSSAVTADWYTYIAAPAVTSLTPTVGPEGGGTQVTVKGVHFTAVSSVTFGGVPATAFSMNSSNSLVATAPPGVGVVKVRVNGKYGASPVSAGGTFTYQIRTVPAGQWSNSLSGPFGKSLVDASCSSRSSCMVVGNQYAFGLTMNWDGTNWSSPLDLELDPASVNSPHALDYDNELKAVSCHAADRCVVVGTKRSSIGALTQRWDGSSWHFMPHAADEEAFSTLNDVSCTGDSFCMAVGTVTTVPGNGTTKTLAEVWDGAQWTVVPTYHVSPVTHELLSSVSCTSPTFCVAVGGYTVVWNDRNGDFAFTTRNSFVQFWDGFTWAAVPSPNLAADFASVGAYTFGSLTSVSCSSVTQCLAVGDMLIEWDGTSWNRTSETNYHPANRVSCVAGFCAASWFGSSNAPSGVEVRVGDAWTTYSVTSSTVSIAGLSCIEADCLGVGNNSDFTAGASWLR